MPINYKAKQGDCIYSIAYEHGFFADTIWNHPDNAELKKKREDPHILMPGDAVFVPDKRLKEVSEPTNQLHKFRCKNTPKQLRIQLKYLETPIADADYKVIIDKIEKTGKTDNEGWLTCSIPPDAKKARIIMEGGFEYDVMLGFLNPIGEISGVQGRLAHLGFYEGEIDGKPNEEMRRALKVFQLSENLEPTGEIDEATKSSLQKLMGE